MSDLPQSKNGLVAYDQLRPGQNLTTEKDNKFKTDDPAWMYLNSFQSENSKRSMTSALDVVSRVIGFANHHYVPWHEFDHAKLLIVRNRFLSQKKENGELKYSPATINNYLTAIRGVCRQAWKLGKMDHEVFMKVLDEKPVSGKRHKEREKFTISELGLVVSYFTNKDGTKAFRDGVIFALLTGTGIRRSELVKLEVSDVLRRKQSIRVKGKGNKERIVPVQKNAFDLVLKWIEDWRGDHAGPLFSRIYKNEQIGEEKLRPHSVNYIFEQMVKELWQNDVLRNKHKFNPHNFRHSFATLLREKTDDISRIQEILGHSDLKTTVGYFIEDEDANADLVDSLGEF